MVPTKVDLDIRAKAVELWISLQQLLIGDKLTEETESAVLDVRLLINGLYGDLP
ncbi:MAG: hypothetical protein [Microvirus sp.]|nr:MAG: hypothetical protein [Microvirus sp.]